MTLCAGLFLLGHGTPWGERIEQVNVGVDDGDGGGGLDAPTARAKPAARRERFCGS